MSIVDISRLEEDDGSSILRGVVFEVVGVAALIFVMIAVLCILAEFDGKYDHLFILGLGLVGGLVLRTSHE